MPTLPWHTRAFDQSPYLQAPATPPRTPSPIKKVTNRTAARVISFPALQPLFGSPLQSYRNVVRKASSLPNVTYRKRETPVSPPVTPNLSPERKKRKKARPYADPSVYAHLPQDSLSDLIAPNLTLLMVGLNPGVMTAKTGRHFASPTNLFWPLMFSSGVIGRPMKAVDSDTLIQEWNVGITNIVRRPTAEGGELSKQEQIEGVADVEALVRRYRPKSVCFTGKGIWDAVFAHLHHRTIKKSDGFKFGWQEEPFVTIPEDGYICNVFVVMGTSGRVAAYSPAQKREIWNELGAWVQKERDINVSVSPYFIDAKLLVAISVYDSRPTTNQAIKLEETDAERGSIASAETLQYTDTEADVLLSATKMEDVDCHSRRTRSGRIFA